MRSGCSSGVRLLLWPSVGSSVSGVDTRVLLVDDHAVVRAGIRLVLDGASGIEVIGEAGTEERALVLARAHQPDVIVLDVLLPGKGGIALIPELLKVSPKSRVLMLSSSAEPATVERALEAGATGYSIKRATDMDLIAAVQAVAAGSNYVHPELGAALAAGRRAPTGPLSARELDVLRLIALGHTNQEIAKQLFISTRTTEMHRASIMRKLHFETRAQLVNYALANGLIGST
jgi:two-component system, NarL family, response regulator NreC